MQPEFGALSPAAQLLWVFGGGFATSLTPCVYPLIPVTLSIFGASEARSRWQAFLLAATYVLGIAVTYTTLGMISARAGVVFGSFLGHPVIVTGVVGFLVILALFTLDIIPLGFLNRLQTSASRLGGKGHAGAFVMGLASGVVAAPCVGPALVLVLGIAASSQSVTWGALLLFTYAMGFGVLFLVLGTFSDLLRRLPRSGNWLYLVKVLMAAALFLVALYLLQPFMPSFDPSFYDRRLPELVFVAGAILTLLALRRGSAPLRTIASLLIAFGSAHLVLIHPAPSAHALPWASTLESALTEAEHRQTIAMVDLYADWCAACKELDAITFPDPKVTEQLKGFALGRVDFTLESPAQDAIVERYAVAGLPCILFLRRDGSEIPDTRVLGFLPPNEFVTHLAAVKSKAGL